MDAPTSAVVVTKDDAGEREGWAQVARPDGKRGWIPRDSIATL